MSYQREEKDEEKKEIDIMALVESLEKDIELIVIRHKADEDLIVYKEREIKEIPINIELTA
jgi:hypothetical protein